MKQKCLKLATLIWKLREWQKIDFCVFGTNFNFNFLINFPIKNGFQTQLIFYFFGFFPT